MTPKQDLRTSLLAEATALLEGGDAEPSLREVARRAGVSAMAPYRHFKDKAALMDAVAEEGFAKLAAALEAADATAEGREALTAQGLAYLAFAEAQPAVFRLMFQQTHSAGGEDSPARKAAFAPLARRAASLAPKRAEAAALSAWGLAHGLADLRLNGAAAATADRMRDAIRLLVDSLAE